MTLIRRIGPVPWLFLLFWLFLMIGGRSRLLRDPGTFWHTAVGEKVLREGFFTGDPYTFSHANQRWVPHQWFGEIVMAALHRVAGFDAFVLLASTILAMLFTWLTLRMLRTGLQAVPVILIVLIAFATGALQFHVRPLLLTMIALTVVAVQLTRYDAKQIPLRQLWWLVPLFVLWANTHGGHLGGVATLGLAWIGWTIARQFAWPTPFEHGRDSWHFLALVCVCALTALANPYGWETPRAWILIMTGPKIPQLIEEHKRLVPGEPASLPLFAFAALYLFVLAGLRQRPRISWLLPLAWLVQAFLRVRHAPLFALTGLVAIAAMWPLTRWAQWLTQHRPDVQDPQRGEFASPRAAWFIPLAIFTFVLFIQARWTTNWAMFDRERWPMELMPDLREHEPTSNQPNRLFNSCSLGGFVIYHVPGYKVFFDDRAELFGDTFLDNVVQAEATNTAAAVERWQREYGEFEFALLTPGTGFDDEFRQRPEWQLVAETSSGAFYRRKRGP